MSQGPSPKVTPETVREFTLSDLVGMYGEEGTDRVEAFLIDGLEVANALLADHGKGATETPAIVYDPLESGVTYDPYHHQGEVLVIGGPRGCCCPRS